LKKELDSLSYLQTFPDVHRRFVDVGCLEFVERLQVGHHVGVAEAFAKSYDGRNVVVGSLKFIADEGTIATTRGIPRSGETWFKTTLTKNLEFRSYLKEEFQGIVWKKSIHVSYLKEEWKILFKSIQLYITSEGRYDKLMLYHIKLLDHFSGKQSLNLPYFFHKNLTKICKKIKSMPLSIRNTLCHYGLIKLIIMQELKSRDRTWEHFLFWEGFEISSQQSDEKGKKKKKQTTPSSTPRKRRILPPSPTVVTDP